MLTTTERQKSKSAKTQLPSLPLDPPRDRAKTSNRGGASGSSTALRKHEDLSDWSNAS